MNQERLDFFKEALLEERKELLDDLSTSNENLSSFNKSTSGDLVDQAYSYYERELLIGLSSGEKETLKQIDKALKKIKEKAFGKCESCSNPIEEKRLEAIPYAELCMDCKTGSKDKKASKSAT